ncbi:DUF551 domain-containing protein [Dysosmobacter sp.]|uniref:DUF551 domain-containing protein n=1 Tax=Dysosmobacter sp. TaxID=2591382 RepID=UPI003AB82C04
MEHQKLLAALKQLKVQTGSLACMGCGYEHDCGIHGCAIIREAVAYIVNLETTHRTEMCEAGYDCTELGKVRKALQAAESKLDAAKRYDWISVKDKMPERSKSVIWAFKDGTIGIWPSWVIVGGVTHWMPLPELPEQEE